VQPFGDLVGLTLRPLHSTALRTPETQFGQRQIQVTPRIFQAIAVSLYLSLTPYAPFGLSQFTHSF